MNTLAPPSTSVPGFKNYMIDYDGKIWNATTNKPIQIKGGKVTLSKDGKRYRLSMNDLLPKARKKMVIPKTEILESKPKRKRILTDDQVRWVRAMLEKRKMTQVAMARELGVHYGLIADIKANRTYRDVE